MGIRGEVFSTKVLLTNRTYFFNVKENRLGDLYLNIVESKNRDEGGFERQSVILFAEDLQEFLQGFDEALKVLEKSVREKRRGAPDRGERPSRNSEGRPPRRDGTAKGGAQRRYGQPPQDGERPFRQERTFQQDRPFRQERGGRERPFRQEREGREREGRGSFEDGSRNRRPFERGSSERGSFERRPHDRSAGRGEGRPRTGRFNEGRREGYKGKDSAPFSPKKRMVVKKR